MKLATSTIKKRWNDKFHGDVNPFTPNVVILDQTEDERFIYELSRGEDFSHQECYGVTVLELRWGRSDLHRTDLSRIFTGRDARTNALNYVKELRYV